MRGNVSSPEETAHANVSFALLYVEDIARSADFYARLLEKPVIDQSPTFAMLPAGDALMLGLWRRDGVASAAGTPGGGELAITAPNPAAVDDACARWSAHGIAIAQAPVAMDFGYTFVALDPDGHRVRVLCPADN